MQAELEGVKHVLLADGGCFTCVCSFLEDMIQKVQHVSKAYVVRLLHVPDKFYFGELLISRCSVLHSCLQVV